VEGTSFGVSDKYFRSYYPLQYHVKKRHLTNAGISSTATVLFI